MAGLSNAVSSGDVRRYPPSGCRLHLSADLFPKDPWTIDRVCVLRLGRTRPHNPPTPMLDSTHTPNKRIYAVLVATPPCFALLGRRVTDAHSSAHTSSFLFVLARSSISSPRSSWGCTFPTLSLSSRQCCTYVQSRGSPSPYREPGPSPCPFSLLPHQFPCSPGGGFVPLSLLSVFSGLPISVSSIKVCDLSLCALSFVFPHLLCV